MKKLLLLTILLFSLGQTAMASHVIGGEIWWECLSNGKFVFHTKIYRDCTGIELILNEQQVTILGNPLPRDSNNNPISTITLKFDSTYWRNSNFGDISPGCDSSLNIPLISCIQGDFGSYQELRYKSEPIQLKGTPPVKGWSLSIDLPCCRPTLTNLDRGGALLLTAIMYTNKNGDSIDFCYNSSPKFAETIDYYSCIRNIKSADNRVADSEKDSIVYSFDRTYNNPSSFPELVTYSPGYSFDNPTPDQNLDSLNVPASLNSQTGSLTYKINSIIGRGVYWIVIRADEYREGYKISSTFREYPVLSLDCDVSNGNQKPKLDYYLVNDNNQSSLINSQKNVLKVRAGDRLKIGFNSSNIVAFSDQYSRSANDTSLCKNPPCAKFFGAPFDSIQGVFALTDTRRRFFDIEWQTTCANIDTSDYIFYFESILKNCDSSILYRDSIRIEVTEQFANPPQNVCVEKFDLENGIDKIRWDTNGTDRKGFKKWLFYKSSASESFYLFDSVNQYSGIAFNNLLVTGQVNDSNRRYYMTSLNFGCFKDVISYPSNTVTAPSLEVEISNGSLTAVEDGLGYTFEWYDCNNYPLGVVATGREFTPPDSISSGQYQVKLVKDRCTSFTDCYLFNPIGLKKNTLQNSISIYPNPTNGLVQIKLENSTKQVNVLVRNIQGQLLKEIQVLNTSSFELQMPQEAGIYFIQLTNEKGERANLKVVKQ